MRVPQDLLRDRIARRGLERDQWKLSHWEEYWSVYGSLECAWSGVQYLDFNNETPLPAEG